MLVPISLPPCYECLRRMLIAIWHSAACAHAYDDAALMPIASMFSTRTLAADAAMPPATPLVAAAAVIAAATPSPPLPPAIFR